MKRRTKRRYLFALLSAMLVVSAMLSACGSKDTAKNVNEKTQVLNLVETQEIPTMDISKATDAVSFIVMTNTMEGLYSLGEGDEVELGVAKAMPVVSDDGLHWKIELRDNAKWSNGDPVTAHDFVYSWQRAIDPTTAAEYAFMLDPIENATAILEGKMPPSELGVKAMDDYTLEVTLSTPAPYFAALLSFPTFYPQQQKFVEAQGASYGTEYDKVLYNGPFALSKWEHEVGWTYEANPNYWDKDRVKLDQINVKVVKDTNTALNLYTSGEVDRVNLAPEQVLSNKERSDFNTEKDSSVYFLRLNQGNEVLANTDVRKAINAALNKQEFCDVLLANGSTPADFLVPEEFVSLNGEDFRETNGSMNTFNEEAATQHWNKAKETLGFEEVTLSLLNYDTDVAKKAGEWMKAELEEKLPGLTVELKSMPFKQKLAAESALDYDMSYAGWGPDYPDPLTFLGMWVTDGPFNQMKYSNTAFDQLIKDAQVKYPTQPEKRWETFQNAEKILIEEDQAIAPLYQKGIAYLENPQVHQIYSHKFGGDYSYKDTYID